MFNRVRCSYPSRRGFKLAALAIALAISATHYGSPSHGVDRHAVAAQATSSPAGVAGQSERFDLLIRNDVFAGLAGDQKAFERAMKVCEETLAKHPQHPQALAWHGAGLLYLAGRSFGQGDFEKGMELWQRGSKEMDEAKTLQPNDIGVLIPRAAILLESSRHVPYPEEAKALLGTAIADYEKTLELQTPYFDQLSVHSRGELLAALAEGHHRLGNREKSRAYFQRITNEVADSLYAERAKAWLEVKDASGKGPKITCLGCHTQ